MTVSFPLFTLKSQSCPPPSREFLVRYRTSVAVTNRVVLAFPLSDNDAFFMAMRIVRSSALAGRAIRNERLQAAKAGATARIGSLLGCWPLWQPTAPEIRAAGG